MDAYNINLDNHANEALKKELIKLMFSFGNFILSSQRRLLLNMATGMQDKKDTSMVHPEDITNFDSVFERLMVKGYYVNE